MRWYEYKAEVDELHAPDDLTQKLLDMQRLAQAEQAAPPAAKARPAIRFGWKKAAGLAACAVLAVGVGAGSLLFGVTGLGMAGAGASSGTAIAAMASGGARSAGISQENGVAYMADATAAEAVAPAAQQASGVSVPQAASTARKLIYTARLTLESKQYDQAREAILQALQSAGGYMEACDEYNYDETARSVTMTLRVPQQNYGTFLEQAAGAGNLVNRSEQVEDVTTQYMDVATRLQSLETRRDKLLEMEQQAEQLSDLLEIQNSLTDVLYQLESWQTQLDWYDDQVELCTVTVSLNEVRDYTVYRETFGERLTGALGDGLKAFGQWLQDLAVALVYWMPRLVLAAVAAFAAWRLWRRKKRAGKGQ